MFTHLSVSQMSVGHPLSARAVLGRLGSRHLPHKVAGQQTSDWFWRTVPGKQLLAVTAAVTRCGTVINNINIIMEQKMPSHFIERKGRSPEEMPRLTQSCSP